MSATVHPTTHPWAYVHRAALIIVLLSMALARPSACSAHASSRARTPLPRRRCPPSTCSRATTAASSWTGQDAPGPAERTSG
jgi:hypothetical protein